MYLHFSKCYATNSFDLKNTFSFFLKVWPGGPKTKTCLFNESKVLPPLTCPKSKLMFCIRCRQIPLAENKAVASGKWRCDMIQLYWPLSLKFFSQFIGQKKHRGWIKHTLHISTHKKRGGENKFLLLPTTFWTLSFVSFVLFSSVSVLFYFVLEINK